MSKVYNPDLFKVNNISEVVSNKNRLLGTPFRVSEKGNFYLVDGKEIPQKVYEKQFPTSLEKINFKGENPNRRKLL